jgi:hypothetical protein
MKLREREDRRRHGSPTGQYLFLKPAPLSPLQNEWMPGTSPSRSTSLTKRKTPGSITRREHDYTEDPFASTEFHVAFLSPW